MIDWSRVKELREDMGEDGFDEVVELFIEEMDDRILVMQTGTSENRSEDLHFLKGSAANLGFAKLHELCAMAEQEDAFELDQIWACYAASKAEFMPQIQIDPSQINTPDNTSSSVMSR